MNRFNMRCYVLSLETTVRTEEGIFDQTNELARLFYKEEGCYVTDGYRFDLAHHPIEKRMWRMACAAQLLLTDTDPNDCGY